MMEDHSIAFVFARDPWEIVTINEMTYVSKLGKRMIRLWPEMTSDEIEQQMAGDDEFQVVSRFLDEEKQFAQVRLSRNRFFLQLKLSSPKMGDRVGLAISPAGTLPGCISSMN